MPNKLTDSEIVNALQKEIQDSKRINSSYALLNLNLLKETVDLINRYEEKNSNLTSDLTSAKAEVERLKEENRILKRDVHFNESGIFNLLYGALVYTKTFEDFNKFRKDFKAEAYKEFAERVKKLPYYPSYTNLHKAVDNLLKELEEK